jgi:hypothetical protein
MDISREFSYINGRSYFRTNKSMAMRVSIKGDIMFIEWFNHSTQGSHESKYFVVKNQKYPYTLIEDCLQNEKGESVTDPEIYANMGDRFDDEMIVINFDNRCAPINWKSH